MLHKTRKQRKRNRYAFTADDRKRAWATTMERHPHLGLWLLQRCRQTTPHPYGRCGKYY